MTRKVSIALFLLWWLPVSLFTVQHRIKIEESKLKILILARIPNFITWPGESGMDDTTKPFILAVIGETPFRAALEEAFSIGDRKINNKKVKLLYFPSPEEIKDCHVLFIAASFKEDLQKILSITKNKSILTVGDTSGFAQNGVHINFYRSGRQMKFELNPFAIRESSLAAHSSLLRIATIIKPGEKIE